MTTASRPVAARATARHRLVASVPFLANMAQSAWSTRLVSSSASSTMTPPGPDNVSPRSRCAAAACSTPACAYPMIMGPKLHMRSTYSLPSTSQTRAPRPRS